MIMMKRSPSSEHSSNNLAEIISLEELFETNRIKSSVQLFKVILYFPVALLLLFVRTFVGIVGFSLLSFLPRTSQKRSTILKGLTKILGLVVEIDDKYSDDSVKLLVANHVSIFDRLAVNVMVPCCTIANGFQIKNIDILSFWKDDDIRYPKDLSDEEIYCLQKYIEDSSVRVLQFPECATTNGEKGLLKFHPAAFSLNVAVQPVLIRVSLSSFMTISPSILNSSSWMDGLWHFISPSTFFKLKTLPSMAKLPEESVMDFSKRVQESMAFAMNLIPTNYTSSDKEDLMKTLKTKSMVPGNFSEIQAKSNVIATSKQSGNVCHLPSIPLKKPTLSLNTAAETFGKTPKERMSSYQIRKNLLLQAARQKYFEKRDN